MKPVITITKYENRKLYNEADHVYVSMLDLGDLVAAGKHIRVLCDITGDDITLECLSRVLHERLRVSDRKHAGYGETSSDGVADESFTPQRLESLIALVKRRMPSVD